MNFKEHCLASESTEEEIETMLMKGEANHKKEDVKYFTSIYKDTRQLCFKIQLALDCKHEGNKRCFHCTQLQASEC